VAAALLSLRDVVVRYGNAVALDLPELDIDAAQVLAIVGPNGGGKSTLLRVLGLLQRPSQGTVFFSGEDARQGHLLSLRRRIAMVFQEPLLLNATLRENAALGLKLRKVDGREIERRLEPWLKRLGIAHLAARSARTLSGGEAQRTSLARALALDPEILLLDEPFAALDPASRESLLRDLQQILQESRITTVLVTHHREEAFALAARVGVLHRGRLLQLGEREEVFHRPASETVAEIVGIENRLPGVVEEGVEELSLIRVNQILFKVAGRFPTGAQVVVCVRPENISLETENCATNGANRIPGRITGISPAIMHRRLTLDCGGTEIVAMIPQNSWARVRGAESEKVIATFSFTAAHTIMKP
jgi:tungstate transport system ATP-binding protein